MRIGISHLGSNKEGKVWFSTEDFWVKRSTRRGYYRSGNNPASRTD